jgi:hypothetical protein
VGAASLLQICRKYDGSFPEIALGHRISNGSQPLQAGELSCVRRVDGSGGGCTNKLYIPTGVAGTGSSKLWKCLVKIFTINYLKE